MKESKKDGRKNTERIEEEGKGIRKEERKEERKRVEVKKNENRK